MVSSSKILTVSYGTFSCTVEGFDDPLDVVKETTHFFRGVVSEDRFFGAEPPQFDPELASEYLRDRLADGNGGTLTLGSPPRVRTAAASAGAMAASFAAEQARAAQVEDLLPDDDTIEATAVLTERLVPEDTEVSHEIPVVDTAPAGAEAAPAPRAFAPDDIAAKLERIRAVVAQAGEPAGEETEDLVQEPGEEMADAVDGTLTDLAPEEPAEIETEWAEPEADLSADLLADIEDAAAEPAQDDLPDLVETLVEAEDLNLLGEDFDLTGHGTAGEDHAALADGWDEDDTAEDDALESLLGELVVESTETEELDLDALADEDLGEADEDEGALDAAVAGLMAGTDTVEDVAVAPEKPAASASQKESALAAAAAAVAALVGGRHKPVEAHKTHEDEDRHGSDEDALDEAWTTEAATARPAAARDIAFDDADEEEDFVAPAAQADTARIPVPSGTPVRARVVKVKRAALEQAIADGTLEEVTDTPSRAAPPAAPAPISESSLSPEEEEELARELAAVKAELASDFGSWDEEDEEDDDRADDTAEADWDDLEDEDASGAAAPLRLDNPIRTPDRGWDREDEDDEDDTEEVSETVRDSTRKAIKMASPARVLLTEREVADDDTSRLLDQTNSEMDEPEGNRRRSAIAHLRAAVAATKADRMLGQRSDAAEDQEPYREDLASVVRPRRPQTAGARTERPVSEPAAPLKLVAEQRIDAVGRTAEAAAPVRPRRVQRSMSEDMAPADVSEDTGFAAYARSVGALDLPELLEAAAAYMSYVEGRDQFSRPQLMTTLRQAEVTDSSREDRLRSFGQLLREGKIRKTSGGRFTAAETISYKPAANG